jgi:hypothetical protein
VVHVHEWQSCTAYQASIRSSIMFVEMPLRDPVKEMQSQVRVVMDLEDLGHVVGFEFG